MLIVLDFSSQWTVLCLALWYYLRPRYYSAVPSRFQATRIWTMLRSCLFYVNPVSAGKCTCFHLLTWALPNGVYCDIFYLHCSHNLQSQHGSTPVTPTSTQQRARRLLLFDDPGTDQTAPYTRKQNVWFTGNVTAWIEKQIAWIQ